MSLERLARRYGYTVRRGRLDPTRAWLIDGDGRLFSAVEGADEAQLRALLAPVGGSEHVGEFTG